MCVPSLEIMNNAADPDSLPGYIASWSGADIPVVLFFGDLSTMFCNGCANFPSMVHSGSLSSTPLATFTSYFYVISMTTGSIGVSLCF